MPTGVPRQALPAALAAPPVAAGPAAVVLYMHGTPSCHLEAVALAEEAERHGVAVVSIDRRGRRGRGGRGAQLLLAATGQAPASKPVCMALQ